MAAPERAKATDDPWGAFCEGPRVRVPGSASGVLRGRTFAAKDLFDVAGHVTGAGSPAWRATHAPAARTAPAVARLLAAGASLVGKTRLDELAFGMYGENPHDGTPVNPAARDRVPGGSSSGSAVAVAAGLADLALGTDSGCSVRLPAAACGILGVRPTHGRVPTDGVFTISPRLDVVGWFASDPDLLRAAGAVLLDPAPRVAPLAGVRVATDAFDLATPAVRAALAPAIEAVVARVGPRRDVRVGGEGDLPALEGFWPVLAAVQTRDLWRGHGAWLAAARLPSKALSPEAFADVAAWTPARDAEAVARFDALAAHVRAVVEEGTVLVLPTTSDLPPRRESTRDERRSFARPTLSLMSVAGVAGLPQVTLPAARLDGCPVGLSLVGPAGSDEQLLALAASPLRRHPDPDRVNAVRSVGIDSRPGAIPTDGTRDDRSGSRNDRSGPVYRGTIGPSGPERAGEVGKTRGNQRERTPSRQRT